MNTKKPNKKDGKDQEQFPGYPAYPASEDIYRTYKEEKDLDPESKKPFNEPSIDKNLDIPGSELDDKQEDTGNEDEENNYYSLDGDNHNDLEEDNQ